MYIYIIYIIYYIYIIYILYIHNHIHFFGIYINATIVIGNEFHPPSAPDESWLNNRRFAFLVSQPSTEAIINFTSRSSAHCGAHDG